MRPKIDPSRMLLIVFGVLSLIAILVAASYYLGKVRGEKKYDERAYESCVSVCASTVGGDHMLLVLCEQNCRNQFLPAGDNATTTTTESDTN